MRHIKCTCLFIIRAIFLYALHNLDPGVMTDKICKAEGSGARSADDRSGKFIYRSDWQIKGLGELENLCHTVYPYAVGNKCRSVFANDCLFSEESVSKSAHKL